LARVAPAPGLASTRFVPSNLPIRDKLDREPADNRPMRSGRWFARVAPLSLGLALWAALPSLSWCPVSWKECRAMFGVANAEAGASMECERVARDTRPAAAPARSTPSPARSAPSTSHCGAGACSLPCDPDADPAPANDRAWCVRPPADGILTRGVEAPASLSSLAPAVPLRTPAVAAPSSRPMARARRLAAIPALAIPHAPPQGRAPPLGVPSDLF